MNVPTQTQTITMSSAELAIVLAAMNIDPAVFLMDSVLLDLSNAELKACMTMGREKLLVRGLAAELPDGSLQLVDELHDLMMQMDTCPALCELHHAGRDTQAIRARIFEMGQTPLLLEWYGNTPADETVALSRLNNTEAVVQWALLMTSTGHDPASPNATSEPYAIAQALFRSIATADRSDPELLIGLRQAGMSPDDAQSFLDVGRRPQSQTYLTKLGQRGTTIRGGAMAWFQNDAVHWLISNFNSQARVVVCKANHDMIKSAVAAFLS